MHKTLKNYPKMNFKKQLNSQDIKDLECLYALGLTLSLVAYIRSDSRKGTDNYRGHRIFPSYRNLYILVLLK